MKIVLIGSGNVATQLGRSFKMVGQEIVQVWSRTLENAQKLAGSLASEAVSDLSKIMDGADLYIIAVKDDAIREVAEALYLNNQLIVHTSGSVGLDVLEGISAKTGVFYPLQTFSQNSAIDFRTIPIAIEGSSAEVTATIRAMADRLSERVIELDSVKRRTLHIAAVFSCNFTNHLYALSQQILNTEGLDFDLLRPLIAEASAKIQMNDPVAVQTGPAVRGDNNTLARHLELLKTNTKLAELYEMLSESIVNINKQP